MWFLNTSPYGWDAYGHPTFRNSGNGMTAVHGKFTYSPKKPLTIHEKYAIINGRLKWAF